MIAACLMQGAAWRLAALVVFAVTGAARAETPAPVADALVLERAALVLGLPELLIGAARLLDEAPPAPAIGGAARPVDLRPGLLAMARLMARGDAAILRRLDSLPPLVPRDMALAVDLPAGQSLALDLPANLPRIALHVASGAGVTARWRAADGREGPCLPQPCQAEGRLLLQNPGAQPAQVVIHAAR